MTAWTHPQEIQARLQKLWNRGQLLSAQLTAEPLFPLRVPLKCPTPRELVDHYGEVKAWINELVQQAGSGRGKTYDLEWREVNHRQLGRNQLPVAAVFEQRPRRWVLSANKSRRWPSRRFATGSSGTCPPLNPGWPENR